MSRGQTVALVSVSVLLFVFFNHVYQQSKKEPRKVRLQTSAGGFVSVTADGTLRLITNGSSTPETFVLVPLTAKMVELLKYRESEVATRLDVPGTGKRQMKTKSGCKCSGTSNAYGFGAYCAPWEEAYQAPWCYVGDDCAAVSGKKGSFGMKHERCPTDADNYPTDASYPTDGRTGQYAEVWKAPEGCECSGYSNKHGYGASCKAWEDSIAPGQIPWCYTSSNCTAATKRKGSFGKAHVECTVVYLAPPPELSPPPPSPPPPPPPPPPSPPPPPKLTRRQKQFLKTKTHQDAGTKLEAAAARQGEYFALVSQTSGGFVTVSPPPSSHAMHAVSREAGLTSHGVFAPIASGHVLAVGTRSILGLCAEAGTSAPLICTGYRERNREPHLKYIRSTALKTALKLRFTSVH